MTLADVDALDAAYKAGALQTRLADGRMLQLRSVDEYIRLRAQLIGQVNAADGVSAIHRLPFATSKGLR